MTKVTTILILRFFWKRLFFLILQLFGHNKYIIVKFIVWFTIQTILLGIQTNKTVQTILCVIPCLPKYHALTPINHSY